MYEKSKECKHCKGKGWYICFECYGAGLIPIPDNTPFSVEDKRVECSECHGKGTVECSVCGGTGKILV